MTKRLSLTFDNGPTPGVTEDVLAVLDEFGVKASFFVCGKNLVDPVAHALLRRTVLAGHWIGNHTMTHSRSLGADSSQDTLRLEIGAVQEMIGSCSHPDRYFRPRGGGGLLDKQLLSAPALRYLELSKYSLVLWNSVPRDWEDPEGWVARALADIDAREWTLLVAHDTATGAMRHLPDFLRKVADRGVEIVQEFPPDCVPMRSGELVADVSYLVADLA